MRRRVSALAIAALTVSAASSAGLGGTARAATGNPVAATFKAATFNMCGYGGSGCPGSDSQKVGWIADTVITQKLEVLALNEVCEKQFSALVTKLAERGPAFSAVFDGTSPAKAGRCGGAATGNAILSKTPITATRRKTFVAQQPGSKDRRSVLCATVRLRSTVDVCTAHLLPGKRGLAVRTRQVKETVAVATMSGRPVLVMGDLNDYPASAALNPVYTASYRGGANGQFVESGSVRNGAPCRCGTPTRGKSKIDYVFSSASDFKPGTSKTLNSPWSDHHLVVATPVWR